MKNKIVLLSLCCGLQFTACKKNENSTTQDFDTLKTTVIADFTRHIAVKTYADLQLAAQNLNASVVALNSANNDANLEQARKNWKDMRVVWEQSEAFLFGPVEDKDYDPKMDTWPTDYNEMEVLLSSSNPLTLSDIEKLPLSLRGFHPLEYILFGVSGNRSAASITARQKQYMISLSEDVLSTCQTLYADWVAAPVLYQNELLNAGKGSTLYKSKREILLALVDGMAGICEEVGTGKIKEPFDAFDSSIVESPYSNNSIADFKNNLIGLKNVYTGTYGGVQVKGIRDLVAAKNKSLDNKIQEQIAIALAAFDNVTIPFEDALFSQRVQTKNIMDALATLQSTLEDELKPFMVQYIND